MLDNFRSCPVCGSIFVYIRRNLCPSCLKEEEKAFELVRKYLNANPNATIIEVAEGTEVAEETILGFLKDGRITSRGFVDALSCTLCGAGISSGSYCDACRNSLSQQFASPRPEISLNPKNSKRIGSSSKKMYSKDE